MDAKDVLCGANSIISFDPKSIVTLTGNSLSVMIEGYCENDTLATIKTIPTPAFSASSVQGTLSFYGLNWNWWKRLVNPSTAICGWIGSNGTNLLAFDIQGRGADPQLIPIYSTFNPPAAIDGLTFDFLADLTLPTDFRVALVFY